MFGFVSKKKLLEILRELAKNNDGISEALLMAEYARRRL